MQPSDWRQRIQDVLDAIREIQEFTQGMDAATFASDRKTLSAVAYHFIVIGEALRNIPEETRARYPTVPWGRIRGMRNIIAHDYRHVDSSVVWDTIQNSLPALVPLLQVILDREP